MKVCDLSSIDSYLFMPEFHRHTYIWFFLLSGNLWFRRSRLRHLWRSLPYKNIRMGRWYEQLCTRRWDGHTAAAHWKIIVFCFKLKLKVFTSQFGPHCIKVSLAAHSSTGQSWAEIRNNCTRYYHTDNFFKFNHM